MSIYHFSASTVSRGKSQSAVASVAYQSAEKIKDEQSGKTKSYTNKREVKYTEILLPDNASEKWRNESNQSKLRADVWNTVEKFEKRKDAVLARKIVVALPEELRGQGASEYDSWKKLVSNYVQETFVKAGMVADWALHDPQKPGKPRNPHVHIMLTVRPLNKNGEFIKAKTKQVYKLDKNGERIPIIDPETGKQKLGARNRKQWKRENVPVTDWEKKTTLKRWRKSWAEAANEYLQEVGAPKIDERSYKEQGKQQLPTKHEGYYAREIEAKNPGSSWKVARNADVRAANEEAAEAAEHERVKIEIEQQIGRQKAILEGTINGIMGQLDARRESRSREKTPGRGLEGIGRGESGLVGASAELTSTSRGQRSVEQPNNGLAAAVGRVAGSLQNARKRAGRLRSAENGQGRSAAASEPTSTASAAMEQIKQRLEDYRRKLIEAWARLQQRLDRLQERLRQLERALETAGKRRAEYLQGSSERVPADKERSPEAKPKPTKKLSLAGGIGGTSTAKRSEKPEEPAFKQPIYGQSKPVDQTTQPKEPQNRHTKHEKSEKLTEEEMYAELTRIFSQSASYGEKDTGAERRKREAKRRKQKFDDGQRQLEETVDRTQAHRLADRERELEERKRELEEREARSTYQIPIYHDQGPDLDL